eukprot:jgi/Botrbrau1/6999/Bobra.0165s0029.1
MPHRTRYFTNRLPDYEGSREVIIDRVLLSRNLQRIVEYVLEKPTRKPTVYTGAAGIAYMVYHVGFRCEIAASNLHLRNINIETATTIGDQAKAAVKMWDLDQHSISLLSGHAGVLLTSALVHDWSQKVQEGAAASNSEAECQSSLSQLCALTDFARLPAADDEVLYGRAGYVLAGLLANAMIGPGTVPQNLIDEVSLRLIQAGMDQASAGGTASPLWYEWPKGRGPTPYLGAAHGTMGILFTLLHVPSALAQHKQTLVGALAYVLSLECHIDGRPGAGGSYPTRMVLEPGLKQLVHWCHGAPGAVFLFCKAYEVLGDEKYLEAAERGGEVVWKYGLLRKGPGLCHGIAGNGYALIALHNASKDLRWLHRALEFARYMGSEEFLAEADTPDHPRSLYEGYAGAACFLADLLSEEPAAARFPFFQV